MTFRTNPHTGLAGGAMPFDMAAPGAADAFNDGRALAAELLESLMADALELFHDDRKSGLMSGLIDDIAQGAAHALDLMGGKEAA